VNPAIKFNHKSELGTAEIDDEWTHGVLSPKLDVVEASVAEELP
jgi:hypothetical protein